jgi:hypothetical protein
MGSDGTGGNIIGGIGKGKWARSVNCGIVEEIGRWNYGNKEVGVAL